MSAIEGGSPPATPQLAGAAVLVPSACEGRDVAASLPLVASSVLSPALPGAPDLSALLAQARAAQRQLAGQPLPIANHNLPLIQKLFGG